MDRLDFIASLTQNSDSIVDVGCDHALTSIIAIKKYNVKFAYALDINDKPLENAKSNIESNGLSDKFKLVKSDGLIDFNDQADTLVISGMGGLLISDILKNSMLKVKRFKHMIFSPNRDSDQLRFVLINNHIRIVDEFMIEDNNKFYEIIVCTNEDLNRKYNFMDMKFGPILREKKPDVFVKFYEARLEQFKENLKKVNDTTSKAKLKMEIAMIEEVLYAKQNIYSQYK